MNLSILSVLAFAALVFGEDANNNSTGIIQASRRLFGFGESPAPQANDRIFGFGKGGGGGGGVGGMLGGLGGTPLGSYPLWKFHKFQGMSLQPVPIGLDIGNGIPAPPPQFMNTMPQPYEQPPPVEPYDMGTPPYAPPAYPPQAPSYGWGAPAPYGPPAGAGWGAPPAYGPDAGAGYGPPPYAPPAGAGWGAPPSYGPDAGAGYGPPPYSPPAGAGYGPPPYAPPAGAGWSAPPVYGPDAGAGYGAPPPYAPPAGGWGPPPPKCRTVCDDDYTSPSYKAYDESNGAYPAASSPSYGSMQPYGNGWNAPMPSYGPPAQPVAPAYGTPYSSAGGAEIPASPPATYDQPQLPPVDQYPQPMPQPPAYEQTPPQSSIPYPPSQFDIAAPQPQMYAPPAVSYEVAPPEAPQAQVPSPPSNGGYQGYKKRRSGTVNKAEKTKDVKGRSDILDDVAAEDETSNALSEKMSE